MKTKITILSALIALFSAAGFGQGLVDEFAISPTNDLTGHFDWIKLAGQTPTTASWGVDAAETAYPSNPGGDGNQAAIVLDTLLEAGTTGVEVSGVLKAKSGTNNFKNFGIAFVTTKDSSTLAGYFAHGQENTSTDVSRIRRISAFNPVRLFNEFEPSGITLSPAATLTREFAVGDTFKMTYYADGRKTWGWRTPGGAWDTTTTTDVTTSLASGFYLVLYGLDAATPFRIDHLVIQKIGASSPPPGATDTQAPVIATQSLFPSNWTAPTTGSITVRITDNYGLDSIYIKFRVAGGTYGDSLKIRCGTTTDTTVVWTITTAKAVGNYEWHVRARDDTGNVTTGTTQLFTVSGSHQWQGYIYSFPVWAAANSNSGGVAPNVDVRTIDYNGISIFIWFPGMLTSSQTAGNYWMPNYSEPPTGQDLTIESNGTGTRWRGMVRDSMTAHGGKFILDLGGAGATPDANWTFIMADSTRTQGFVDSALAYARLRGYDGVATNWEFPGTADRDNLSRMLRRFRAGLDAWPTRGMLITWVSGRYNEFGSPYDATQFNANVDLTLPMQYGYGQGSVLEHNTMLYEGCGYPCPGGGCAIDNGGIKSYLAQGFDTSKMVMVTTFENIWITQSTAALCGSRTGNPSYTSYQNTLEKLAQYPASYNWSDVMKVPYLIYTEGGTQTFAAYENQQSLIEKLKYGESLNLKWFGVWDNTRGHLANPPAGHTAQELHQTIAGYISGDQDTTSVAGPPTLLSPSNGATDVDKSNVSLRWNTKAGATSYQYQLSTSATFSPTVLNATTTDTSVAVSVGLLNFSTTYYWRVASINAAGQGGYASAFSFQSSAQTVTPPTTPTLVNPASNATGVTVPISFRCTRVSADSIITGWDFELGVGSDTSALTLDQSVQNLTDTQYVYSNQIPYSTVHWWRMRAKNPAGNSGYTAWRKFTTSSAPITQTGKNQKFGIVDHNGKKYYTTLPYIDLTPRLANEVQTPDSGTYAVFVGRNDGRLRLIDWLRNVDSATVSPHTHAGEDISSGLVALDRTVVGLNFAAGTSYTIGGKRRYMKTNSAGGTPYPDSITVGDLPYLTPGKQWIGGPGGSLIEVDTSVGNGTNLGNATEDDVEASINLRDSNKTRYFGPTDVYAGMVGADAAGLYVTGSTGSGDQVGMISGNDGSGIQVTGTGGVETIQQTATDPLGRDRTTFTNSDGIIDKGARKQTTTNSTATSAFYMSLDSNVVGVPDYSADGTTFIIYFDVVGNRTDAAGYATYSRKIVYQNAAGVVTEAAEDVIGADAESNANTGCLFAVNGDAAEVSVIGDNSQTWIWHVHYRIIVVGN